MPPKQEEILSYYSKFRSIPDTIRYPLQSVYLNKLHKSFILCFPLRNNDSSSDSTSSTSASDATDNDSSTDSTSSTSASDASDNDSSSDSPSSTSASDASDNDGGSDSTTTPYSSFASDTADEDCDDAYESDDNTESDTSGCPPCPIQTCPAAPTCPPPPECPIAQMKEMMDMLNKTFIALATSPILVKSHDIGSSEPGTDVVNKHTDKVLEGPPFYIPHQETPAERKEAAEQKKSPPKSESNPPWPDYNGNNYAGSNAEANSG